MDKIENSYLEYLKIFIDANKQWKLKKVMDFDHDLPIISEYITDWESKLQVPLGIPANKVKDIKAVGRYNPTQPVLERKEVLTVWKGIVGTNATYENLIKACIKGEHADAGERICKYIQETTKARCDTDSGSLSPPKDSEPAADHEEPTYTKKKEKKLVLKHEPDLPPAEEKELESFCKEINVIIHVVNEYEFEAATTYITAPNRSDGNGIRFHGHVLGMFAKQKVAVALVQTRPGADCYEDIQNAIKELSLDVQYIFGVGVCYSLDRGKHCFGDILVANRISSFETHKKCGSDILPRGERIDISQYLRKIFCQQTIYWNDTFKVSRNRCSKAYCGLLISAPILLSSSEEVKKFKDAEREAIGGEMEGFKLLKMKRRNGQPMEVIVIKGVVDYGDEKKDKVWQFTTAMAAFNFAEKMIQKKGANFSKSTEHKPTRSSSNGSIPLLECAGTPTLGQKRSRSEEESTGPKQKKNKGNRTEADSSKVQKEIGKRERERKKKRKRKV